MPRSQTDPETIELHKRRAEALQLRIGGATVTQIAERLGYAGPSGASQAIKAAIADLTRPAAQELVALESARLDALMLAHWSDAVGRATGEGRVPGDVRSAELVLKVIERRCRLLGLDAPRKDKLEVLTMDAFASAMSELETEVRQLEQQAASQDESVAADGSPTG